MAEFTTTEADVAPVNETEYLAKTYIAGAKVTAGQIVTINGQGQAIPAPTGTTVDKQAGVALVTANAGFGVTCLLKGTLYGVDVSAQAPFDQAGLSGTVNGGWADTAAAGSRVGVVLPMPTPASARTGGTPATYDMLLWVDFTKGWLT
jgi:hypothetical protein